MKWRLAQKNVSLDGTYVRQSRWLESVYTGYLAYKHYTEMDLRVI
jgi:hypothetical protein